MPCARAHVNQKFAISTAQREERCGLGGRAQCALRAVQRRMPTGRIVPPQRPYYVAALGISVVGSARVHPCGQPCTRTALQGTHFGWVGVPWCIYLRSQEEEENAEDSWENKIVFVIQ
jgi:hypothetical protein